MRMITSVVAMSVFVSLFVWMSALATQTTQDMSHRNFQLHGLQPAR